ncbi:hypothetical protein [Marimonas arenosa]|uniref:Uncharacterized protein n=1 Tax=Marimonas arenosa TaxID=1795305 RepID=A0AAE4B7Z8_9RHOB|nr:hypothetical protein [Marimonas arenosa]MDQ2092091.1 hypothetical protein [Marimonas arenosa]
MFRGFLLTCGLVGGLAALPLKAHEVDHAKQQSSLLRFFSKTCLKTFPTYSGIEKPIKAMGLKHNARDDTWSGGGFFINPTVDAANDTYCFAVLNLTNPKGIAQELANTLSRSGATNIKVVVKGRKTYVDFSLKGVAAKVIVKPLGAIPTDRLPRHHRNDPTTGITLLKKN